LPPEQVIEFHHKTAALKGMLRRGWEARSVPDPESIADHSFSVCALSVIFARTMGLDPAKVLTSAVLHDLCEAICGDIIPADAVHPREKLEREQEATREILGELDETRELHELWLDTELERTPEGRLVKQLDILEMILQADLYEEATGVSLDEFYEAGNRIDIPELKDVFRAVRNRRDERRSAR
jgi:putative hydrolase of HD superfamily